MYAIRSYYALGGVAAGNMNAQEAAIAIMTDSAKAEIPRFSATPEKSGIINAAVAVLEASSVT